MSNRIQCADLQIDEALHSLLFNEVAPGTGIDPDHFWRGVADIWVALGPENQRLLAERDSLQTQIDQWHREHPGKAFCAAAYEAFLRAIGYLHPEPAPFNITTDDVDPEIAQIAGPQLVVPVMNARYALNAANARWGSLYDALYGTDAIPEDNGAERGGGATGRSMHEINPVQDPALPIQSTGLWVITITIYYTYKRFYRLSSMR